MSVRFSPPTPLDREFLPTRAKILEIAAALDRIQRAAEEIAAEETVQNLAESTDSSAGISQENPDDPRWQQLQAGIQLLLSGQAERAEQVQLLFSRPYDEQWRETLKIPH